VIDVPKRPKEEVRERIDAQVLAFARIVRISAGSDIRTTPDAVQISPLVGRNGADCLPKADGEQYKLTPGEHDSTIDHDVRYRVGGSDHLLDSKHAC
jgi:hypothetical protein